MKTLKAYTFEELLCEIPELEKYKETYLFNMSIVGLIFEKFARQNKLRYLNKMPRIYLLGVEHFLFEKI